MLSGLVKPKVGNIQAWISSHLPYVLEDANRRDWVRVKKGICRSMVSIWLMAHAGNMPGPGQQNAAERDRAKYEIRFCGLPPTRTVDCFIFAAWINYRPTWA